MVKATWRTDHPCSAIFCVIVHKGLQRPYTSTSTIMQKTISGFFVRLLFVLNIEHIKDLVETKLRSLRDLTSLCVADICWNNFHEVIAGTYWDETLPKSMECTIIGFVVIHGIVTWIFRYFIWLLTLTGVMHEADNAYSIWSTWSCYWLDKFLTQAFNTRILLKFSMFHWICLLFILLILVFSFLFV